MAYTPTPATRNSIVIVKSGSYRGGTRQWSNRDYFEGDLPTDDAAWEAFADAIIASLKTCLTASLTIVEARGYDSSTASLSNLNGDAVWAKSYSVAGTFAPVATDNPAPGDCATLLRYSTDARSANNHPIYHLQYFHNTHIEGGTADSLAEDQKALVEAYMDDWLTGFPCDGTNRERCGMHGAVATGRRVDPYVRHRDFPN